jgi:putative ABC transport system permease protein
MIRPARSEVEEELAFHLEQRERDYAARGLSAAEARSAARERLGDLEEVGRECTALLGAQRRSEARRERLGVSWLDFKLGARMLVRYPGLTLVGGLAMAFAIWVGAGTFEAVTRIVRPTLPLDEGHRVVGIRLDDAERGRTEFRSSYELAAWRDALTSIDHLGAFRTLDRNLITGDGIGEPVEVAEMSASGFRVARVSPVLGRTLVESDEAPGASPVVVIGHDVWQSRFGGDPDVIGRAVRLGRSTATVVGVMPDGFAFPISQRLWTPLSREIMVTEPRQGPSLRLFGRLAPGATLSGAQAELTALGERMAADHPETHAHIRPKVMPYATSILQLPMRFSLSLVSINLFLLMLLVLICGNVALLMFARATTREGEIVVRSALGASRGRIISQLFVEALMLGALAAVVGLVASVWGVRWMLSVVETDILRGEGVPFWIRAGVSPATVLYTVILTLLGAGIAGVLPALKMTGGETQRRLRQASAGGGGLRFGGVWTAVIVAQVAVTLAFPACAFFVRRDALQVRDMVVGFPTSEYLAARVEMDRDALPGGTGVAPDDTAHAAFLARFREAYRELEHRLESDPAIAGVTSADRLPRMYHPHRRLEVEGGGAPAPEPGRGHRVGAATVALDFFEVLDAPILAGRGFHPSDIDSDPGAVIANQSFVDLVLGGRNPIGQRVRYLYLEESGDARGVDGGPAPWYEIVGVVRDMGMASGPDPKVAGLYHPAAKGEVYPVQVAMHVHGDPAGFVPRLRMLTTAVDPSLRLYEPTTLDRVNETEQQFFAFWFWILVLVSGVALLLSLAGIYSVMSFAVSRRTREIGIRVALGADRRRVIAAIFARPATQVLVGLAGGVILTAILSLLVTGDVSVRGAALVAGYAALMMAICMTACVVPTRRALNVEPVEALRADG